MMLPKEALNFSIFKRRRTPVIMQTEASECGLACLAMIAAHYGYRIDLPALRRDCNISLKGTTLRDLIRIASQMRLVSRALRTEMDQLHELHLPCILHWDHNHFVVLTALRQGGAVVYDPGIGARTLSLSEVSGHFTGIVLEVLPAANFERKTVRAKVRILDLIRQAHGISSSAAQVFLLSAFLEIVLIAMPLCFQLILDEAIVGSDRNLLTLIVLFLGFLLGLRVFVDFVRQWSIMAAGARLTLQWKISLFSHMLRLPLSFFERRHVGDVASRFASLDVVQKTLTSGPVTGIMDGIMSVVLLVMMWFYSPLLTLIAVASMSIYTCGRLMVYRIYRIANEEAIVYGARESSHFIETLRGMPSIKAMIMGQHRQAAWNSYLADHVSAEFRVQKLQLVYRTAIGLLFGVDRILVIFFGAKAVLDGTLTVGMLVALLAYKDQFSNRVSTLLDTAVNLKLLGLHSERIADVALSEPEEVSHVPAVLVPLDPSCPSRPKAALSAREISFRYGDNEPPILSGLDFDVAPGECVAITGPSGAGKTTFLKILAGLLRPTAGAVLLNHIPIQSIGLELYRSQIGIVLQDDRLFGGSIAENIAGFTPDYDMERVQDAANLAAIHDDILRMPMGYETLVGDMGSALSGGQIQRIVLARSLYRGPRVLLLDEATSHLDDDNERRINASIRSLPISRVIVAHRKTTVEMADRVFCLLPVFAPGVSRNNSVFRVSPALNS